MTPRDATPAAAPPPAFVPLGALRAWRAELAAGKHGQHPMRRETWRYDALWRAACWEAQAMELYDDRLFAASADCLRHAAEILAEAHRRRRAS